MADEDVSFDPDEAVEGGGGLLPAVKGATLSFKAVMYDYGGSVAVPSPSIHVHGEYQAEGDNGPEDGEFDEYYSAGDATKLRAKKDGSGFQAVSEGAKMVKTCKAMQLITSIVNANGGDKSIIPSDIRELDGINVDMERKPDIDRPGLSSTNAKGRKRTIMLVTEINSLPGESPKKGKGKTAKPAGKPLKGNTRKRAIELVNAALKAAGDDGVPVEEIGQVVFRANKKDPSIKEIVEIITNTELLSADDTPWGNDGETLTYQED